MEDNIAFPNGYKIPLWAHCHHTGVEETEYCEYCAPGTVTNLIITRGTSQSIFPSRFCGWCGRKLA
jgi:hypothetical protein